MFSFCMKTNFIIFTLLKLRDTRTVNCVRNTAWRRRKQTYNCAAAPCLSTRADCIKHVSHTNLSCTLLRELRCLRLNVRPALHRCYIKIVWLMTFRKVIALNSENHVNKLTNKQTNTLVDKCRLSSSQRGSTYRRILGTVVKRK